MFNNIEDNTYSVEWDINYDANEINDISYRIEATDSHNLLTSTPTYNLDFVVPNENNDVEIASGFTSVYPNPFSDTLNIAFRSKSNNQVVKIYNLKGQLVREIESFAKADSTGNVKWNGKDNDGKRVSSGVYYMVLESEDFRDVRKVLMMK